jgi:hypothetical protein
LTPEQKAKADEALKKFREKFTSWPKPNGNPIQ